jgi:hypothetical protein
MLFSRFDRLLFLGKGGRTIYFGDIGKNSSTLLDYFSRNGANPIDPAANPAEYMFSVGGPVTDWHQVWLDSPERAAVKAHLAHLKKTLSAKPRAESQDKRSLEEFAAPISQQGVIVGKRFFQQLWRTPDYIWSKLVLCAIIGLFIGFSFINADSSRQGLLVGGREPGLPIPVLANRRLHNAEPNLRYIYRDLDLRAAHSDAHAVIR